MFGDQYINNIWSKEMMDKILRIGIISDERKRDTWVRRKLCRGLQWLYALLFTRVNGTRKQSCNLEAEAEAQHTDGGPWWGLRGTGCQTWPDPQVPQVPKASLGVRGNLTHCNALCGASAQKRQGRGQGTEALQGSSPASRGCIRWGWEGGEGSREHVHQHSKGVQDDFQAPGTRTSTAHVGVCSQCSGEVGQLLLPTQVYYCTSGTNPRAFFLTPPLIISLDSSQTPPKLSVHYQNICSLCTDRQQPREKRGTLSTLAKTLCSLDP